MAVGFDERARRALAEIEAQRDDVLVWLSAARAVLEVATRGLGVRPCAGAVAQQLVAQLGLEACAVALREGDADGDTLWLAGVATQADRLGGPRDDVSEAGWLTLARLEAPDGAPTCFRRTPDAGFAAVTVSELDGEGFMVLPFQAGGETAGALVLHTLVAPAQTFGRGPALAMLGDIVGQVLTMARMREATGRLCDRLSEELGAARRVLSVREESLRAREESLGALTQELLRSNRAKSEFLSTVSHELRTPLNAILGYTSLLRDGVVGALAPEQLRLLERALGSTRNLGHLIDDVLFFVQLEADTVLVRPEPLAVAEVVEDVLAALPDRPDPGRVAFAVTIAPEAATVRSDAALLRRILFHLVGNAFKFTADGCVDVAVRSGAAPGEALVVVRDTGCGIPVECQGDVFDAFAQLDASDTRRHGGLGMGLALVQRAVRLLGGEVTLESEPGAGSEFRVVLPGAIGAATRLPADLRAGRALH
ncbi:MAG: HAMP domain-containing histidine kinase [bacterium]|nr:HAMP domain-containing histidine kinase [bacterium]